MNKLIASALAISQYLCNFAAVVLTIYLVYRWNAERSLDPTFDAFNPWWPGLVLLVLGAVFKLARKGVAAQQSKSQTQARRTDA